MIKRIVLAIGYLLLTLAGLVVIIHIAATTHMPLLGVIACCNLWLIGVGLMVRYTY